MEIFVNIFPLLPVLISTLRIKPRQFRFLTDPGMGARTRCNDIATLRHTAIAPDEGSSYNVKLLGISLAVGRLTLDQLGQVRILDPQPC